MKKTLKMMFVFLIAIVAIGSIYAETFEKVELLDDFGDPTGVSYIQAKKDFDGTYKNSNGISNGKLKWNIKLEDGKVTFVLKENGQVNQLSTVYYTSDTFDVKVKVDEIGETSVYSGTIIRGEEGTYNCIEVKGFIINNLSSLLMDGYDCKIVISNARGSYSLGALNTSEIETLWYDVDSFEEIKSLYENGDYETALVNMDILKSADEKTYKHFETELDEICLGCKYGLGSIDVGMRGPAGGLVFYDCDADNESGNRDGLVSSECGWRFLEAAPSVLEEELEFGPNVAMDLPSTLGSGKSNTEALVAAFGEGKYAAKACYDYEITVDGVVYDDWFLPSSSEFQALTDSNSNFNDEDLPIKKYTKYWTSTAWTQSSANRAYAGEKGWSSGGNFSYGTILGVCPIRAFVQ